eukprot:TRINITY_DN396_c0_g1_i4.p1 TRINITY_DN396_c0_g1~~TRINITY_DN396_c0_g1_i4.p1  ORF type:complete len:210 (-),score=67.95 TRINITY_DN396_c0_g1_i4:118-747(-)
MSKEAENEIPPTATDEGGEENPEAEANVNFEPVIKLKAVETKTFEEEEDVLFKMRAKLFGWGKDVSGQPCWRERGTGDVKFLKHQKTGKSRMLMRREKTFKVCANFYITPQVNLKVNPTSDRSWIWAVVDYSEEPKEELFAIRFATSENANKFKEEFEKLQGKSAGSSSSSSSNTDSTTPQPSTTTPSGEGEKSEKAEKPTEPETTSQN